jgi:hypothetical protein
MEKYNALSMILFYIWYKVVAYILAVPSGTGSGIIASVVLLQADAHECHYFDLESSGGRALV